MNYFKKGISIIRSHGLAELYSRLNLKMQVTILGIVEKWINTLMNHLTFVIWIQLLRSIRINCNRFPSTARLEYPSFSKATTYRVKFKQIELSLFFLFEELSGQSLRF
jgi:hypothetical protein